MLALAPCGITSRASSRVSDLSFCLLANSHLTGKSSSLAFNLNRQSLCRFSSMPQSSSVDGGSNEQGRLFPEELNIIYDSKCNVCNLEIEFLARRDAKFSGSSTRKLKMTDLEDGAYNPDDPANGGIPYAKGMAAIHAVTADGKVIEGVPVFSSAYQLVGLGWLFKFTEWPVFETVVRWGYDIFAKYRTNVTRGSSLENLVQAYEAKQALDNKQKAAQDCESCNSDVVRT